MEVEESTAEDFNSPMFAQFPVPFDSPLVKTNLLINPFLQPPQVVMAISYSHYNKIANYAIVIATYIAMYNN